MAVQSLEELAKHISHHIVCSTYQNLESMYEMYEIYVECLTCSCVLFEIPENNHGVILQKVKSNSIINLSPFYNWANEISEIYLINNGVVVMPLNNALFGNNNSIDLLLPEELPI